MKRCPKCKVDYFDNMLEFCIEDGTRLDLASKPAAVTAPFLRVTEPVRQAAGPIQERVSVETVVVPGLRTPEAASSSEPGVSRTSTMVERLSISLALAHNWWQWLYLEKTYISSITDFVLSANFLMWLLLLGTGTAAGIYSVKNSRDKTLGIISLVALGINLILFFGAAEIV